MVKTETFVNMFGETMIMKCDTTKKKVYINHNDISDKDIEYSLFKFLYYLSDEEKTALHAFLRKMKLDYLI